MNSTRTTNILLTVLLLVSVGNYMKTSTIEGDVINLETTASTTMGYAFELVVDMNDSIDWRRIRSDNIEMETQMTKGDVFDVNRSTLVVLYLATLVQLVSNNL